MRTSDSAVKSMDIRETEIKTCGAWGLLVASIETILNGWEKEDQVLAISENIRALAEEVINIRLKEVRMKQYETWARENEEPVRAEEKEEIQGWED